MVKVTIATKGVAPSFDSVPAFSDQFIFWVVECKTRFNCLQLKAAKVTIALILKHFVSFNSHRHKALFLLNRAWVQASLTFCFLMMHISLIYAAYLLILLLLDSASILSNPLPICRLVSPTH